MESYKDAIDESITKEEIKKEKKMLKKEKKKHKKEFKYEKFLAYSPSYDIKYLGPIGVRTLKLIAWILLACAASMIGFSVYLSVTGKAESGSGMALILILHYAGQLAIPCFMLTKFSIIIKKRTGHVEMIIKYGLASLAVLVLFNLLYFHYAVPLIAAAKNLSFSEATKTLNGYFSNLMGKKLAFNVFIDMFMWSLYFFFIDYNNPKLTGKKLIVFRLFSIIPIIYVITCFTLKICFATGSVYISPEYLPLLSTSSPFAFLAFVMISLFLKNHKKLYLKIGGTPEGYEDYLKTNANSFHFSKVTALCFIIVGLLDIIIKVIVTASVSESLAYSLDVVAGIGDSAAYLAFAPFILLFSYTRQNKDSKLDIIIPIVGVVIVVIFAFEGFFQTAILLIGDISSIFKYF